MSPELLTKNSTLALSVT
nr:unnamed protein product [Callosobruchus chinensis]